MGDVAGVGPELAAKLLADPALAAQDVVVGSADVLAMGARNAGVTLDLPRLPADTHPDRLPSGHVLLDLANCGSWSGSTAASP